VIENQIKVAGVVVLFNPPSNIIQNINSYFYQIDYLWIIDNSPVNNSELFQSLEPSKFSYLPNFNNIGIGAALNIAAKNAIEQKFDFLLTMDQDSSATPNMIRKMLDIYTSNDIGIISARHNNKFEIHSSDKGQEDITIVMTAGNLVNLHAYKQIGGFNENLFIDYVDHEFCLRLLDKNFRIIKVNNAIINHTVGNTTEIKLGFFKIYPTNHDPIRHFYQTRNRFYLKKLYKNKYPLIIKYDMKLFRNNIIKIILFEKNKINKILMILKGYIHFRKQITGKYPS
jgi:rhamnosyltransferase